MNRFYTSLIVPAVLVAAVSLPASAAAPSLTPDQQLVAGLRDARSAARATLRGKAELGKLAEGMRRARRAARTPLARSSRRLCRRHSARRGTGSFGD